MVTVPPGLIDVGLAVKLCRLVVANAVPLSRSRNAPVIHTRRRPTAMDSEYLFIVLLCLVLDEYVKTSFQLAS
jgi:hypothetical protein